MAMVALCFNGILWFIISIAAGVASLRGLCGNTVQMVALCFGGLCSSLAFIVLATKKFYV